MERYPNLSTYFRADYYDYDEETFGIVDKHEEKNGMIYRSILGRNLARKRRERKDALAAY